MWLNLAKKGEKSVLLNFFANFEFRNFSKEQQTAVGRKKNSYNCGPKNKRPDMDGDSSLKKSSLWKVATSKINICEFVKTKRYVLIECLTIFYHNKDGYLHW